MTDRIDHAAESERLLADANGLIVERAAVMVGAAHVRATLALVEQQRIANRLKVAELDLLSEVAYRRAGGYALNFKLRPYLTNDDWKSIEAPEDDEVFS